MAEITVALIKELRDKTNAGMMDCKAALKEADGDIEAAETVLRKKGIADADKKAGRAATEGAVAARIVGDLGILVEVNSETDFVAKNDNFRDFVEEVIDEVEKSDAETLEALLAGDSVQEGATSVEEMIKAKVGQLGENLGLARFTRFKVNGTGVVSSYIHMQGKVGVLIEVNCGNADSTTNEAFQTLVKDLTLHIAAADPICLTRDEVDGSILEKEEEIFRDQMKDKPAEIIDKIIGGKMDKFYSSKCLVEQAFVKDTDQTIKGLVESVGKEIGDEVSIARFERYALGSSADA